ncbi:MAG: hypothetical protein EXR51_07415 [Dehalococcoidia bacterium]|nr:hypothetical protein [Dehalococcoidia bacterium]
MGRALFCYVSGRCVVIPHAFVKKDQATPERELAIALRRLKQVHDG